MRATASAWRIIFTCPSISARTLARSRLGSPTTAMTPMMTMTTISSMIVKPDCTRARAGL
jgi:hypothetical protein